MNRRKSHRNRYLRTAILIGLVMAVYYLWDEPRVRQTIGLPLPAGETVNLRFALCEAPGYDANCVVDGDTFRIGDRRIRVEAIDAPEREGECPAETQLSIRSTRALQDWLNRGRFQMIAQDDVRRDQYARELQTVWRERSDGGREDLATYMRDAGLAAFYDTRSHADWC